MSVENSEKIFIDDFLNNGLEFNYWAKSFISLKGTCLLDPKMWKTEEGKNFCHKLREALPYEAHGSDEEKWSDFLDWDQFSDETPNLELDWPIQIDEHVKIAKKIEQLSTPEPISSSASTASTISEIEIEVCMICMDRKPSTMVLPCMHSVVCGECSRKLQNNTRDAHMCIQCRTLITDVLYQS